MAAEIENDEELREYRARDIFGFVPGAGYAGRLNVHLETIALERLIEKSAAEEDFSLSPSERVESESEPREDSPLPSKAEALSTFPEGEGKKSEANEGRDMLSQEEGKDGAPREDLTSSVNSVDSFPEGEAEEFGGKATKGEAENKAEQSEVNGND